MTDREKQIEEIAKVLNECCGFYDEKGVFLRNKCNSHDCEFWCDTNHICCSYNDKQATALYNVDYRKIPDGAVVLSIEEIEEFRKDQAEVKFLKNKIVEQVRKETARGILNELYVQFSADYLVGLRNEYKDWKYADLIKRYAKSIGVEIKE